ASGLNGSKLSQSVCGDEGTIQVLAHPGAAARTANKGGKPGRLPLRVVAKVKGGKPDLDAITLFCSPRPTGEACPAAPTTTTTTTTSPPTTTTTVASTTTTTVTTTTTWGAGTTTTTAAPTTTTGWTTPTTVATTTTTVATTTTTSTTIPSCSCAGGAPSKVSFTTGIGSGTCGHLDGDGDPNFLSLNCGGLYFGGSGVGVPLPSIVPDQGMS